MLHSVNRLHGYSIVATDGELGRVDEFFFDDERWTVRYLVVSTGGWLAGRKVLISPYAVKRTDPEARTVEVSLTREQVKDSPDIDTHQPVSRRHEADYLQYYGYPTYWGSAELWGLGGYPLAAPAPAEMPPPRAEPEKPEDVHLRSTKDVKGYHVQASDDSFGHVDDFLFDPASWAIHYLVIDTSNWWPGSKRVLVATKWIDNIDWAESKVYTGLTKDSIKHGPEYDEDATIDRDYETRLHEAHGRKGYWI